MGQNPTSRLPLERDRKLRMLQARAANTLEAGRARAHLLALRVVAPLSLCLRLQLLRLVRRRGLHLRGVRLVARRLLLFHALRRRRRCALLCGNLRRLQLAFTALLHAHVASPRLGVAE